MVVASLEQEIAELKSNPAQGEDGRSGPTNPERYPTSFPFLAPGPAHIRRIDGDTLFSDDFVHRNYFVHVSSNQTVMTIRPHVEGNVLCIDKRIQLNGLSLISPYGGPTDVPAEYNPKYGGFLVMLKYSPAPVAVPRQEDSTC
jgi:hypothetical protein